MRTARLGASGPELTVIGFGAWEASGTAWGPNESEDAVVAAMRAGFDAGINWIDTAEVYGSGVSESIVGKAVAGRGDVLVASKVGPKPDGSGFRPAEVRAACAASLGRLGIDRLDLYQLHWPDETGVPLEDTWGAMAGLQDEGLVGAIGVSNFDRGLIERCEAIRHVDSLQQQFSMLALDDRDLIRWCGEVGTGVVSYGPLGFGFLTGTLTRERAAQIDDWRREEGVTAADEVERALALVERLRPIADGLGISMAALALAWNHHQPGVTSAIAGSRDPDHTRDNAGAGDVILDETTLAAIEAAIAG
jgi:aryl-alcohol dehydrogenase-like predicted oxidoreductase